MGGGMTVGVTIVGQRQAGRPAVRLYLLHHAGGSRTAFRGWPALFPGDWEVARVEAPGRGSGGQRLRLSDFVESVLAQIPCDGVPWAVFGHSMGGLSGFALAMAAESAGRELPVWLGVSAHPGPRIANQHGAQLHRLPAEALRDAVVSMGGAGVTALVDDGVWSRVEPVVRRDLVMAETWLPTADPPVIRVPITVYCGQDDPVAAPVTADAWATHTERFRGVRVFPGGHFYFQQIRDRVTHAIMTDVLAALSELEGVSS
jgi:surfactin synthase thioesterase subunit